MIHKVIRFMVIAFLVVIYIYSFPKVERIKYSYQVPKNGNTQLFLKPGLNIIAIDLGGPEDSDRANGAYGDATIIEQNGNYLLIDTGTNDTNNVLINYLKEHSIDKFSIYLSHFHSDHYGKIKQILQDSYFTVDKVYLPDTSILASRYDEEADVEKEWFETIDGFYNSFVNYKNSLVELGANVVFLGLENDIYPEIQSTFNIGEAQLKVIWDATQLNYTVDELYSSAGSLFKNHFMNDTSLVSMITYKNTKFLTAGDIEKNATNEIASSDVEIKADIFKFMHHGSISTNVDVFIDRVNPKYGYLPNNYTAGENNIIWFADRGASYKTFIEKNAEKMNILSTLYNGNIIYNISEQGIINTYPTRNYNTLGIQYIKKGDNEELSDSEEYYFNDRSVYHFYKNDYLKSIDDYTLIDFNTEANGMGNSYMNNDIVDINESQTLYAIYTDSFAINHYESDYVMGEISGIELETDLEMYQSNFTLLGGYILSIDLDGKDYIYTGSISRVMKNNIEKYTFTNMVLGDNNGDGKANSGDLLKIRQHLLNIVTLDDVFFTASDINKDNIINSGDLLRMRQHLLGTQKIS